MEPSEKEQILISLQDELNGVYLYLALGEIESDPRLAEVYRRMAASEKRHVDVLRERLGQSLNTLQEFTPTWRTRSLVWLARRLGVGFVLPNILSMEKSGSNTYSRMKGAAQMAADEKSHARLLGEIARSTPGGLEGGLLAQFEGRHRAGGGNALRAAVLGANDGLVSNLSLVMGVAGAQLPGKGILITGLAGLLAGACSMALGEWLSVQSSRELFSHQIAIEKAEISANPAEETEELALIYQARGLGEQQARLLSSQIMSDQASALDTLAREELNVAPEELGGSPWEAAFTSFILFTIGAIVPVSPFLFLSGTTAILTSIGLSTIGLFLIGAGTSLFTGRGALFSGTRMVVFSLAAAALTFLIGRLIGVNLGG